MATDIIINEEPIALPDRPNVNNEFSSWMDQGDGYTPVVKLTIKSKLPAGLYKVIVSNNDYKVVPIELNTDQLYSFSEGFINTILTEVEKFWNKADVYKENNLVHKRGLLLCGPAGCGKTSLIALLMKQLIEKDGLIFLARNAEDFTLMIEAIKFVVREIEPDRPIISVIEDVDKLIDTLGSDADLLTFMDGGLSIDHHMIILTSNDTTCLSDALLRPSRIDMRYEVPKPTKTIRKEFFIKKGLSEEVANEYANLTSGMSLADLKEVFIGTQILEKPVDTIITQLRNPHTNKDYLNTNKKVKI